MKKLFVFVATVVAALAVTAAANAGCMATVGLSSMPKARPHGRASRGSSRSACSSTAARRCRTRSPRSGSATPPASCSRSRRRRPATVGSYRARVVFPKAGRYTLGVYDGFPFAECARVHTFKSVVIVARLRPLPVPRGALHAQAPLAGARRAASARFRGLQNPYARFIAIPYQGENLYAFTGRSTDTTTKRGQIEMAAAETTTETEQERIERWRAEELERAGYEATAASLLASRPDVDLHYAIDLLRNGCAPELALQILL